MTKHIVALSGGKDSTAMALALSVLEPRDYVFVITPTGNELPAMMAHWQRLAQMLGRPLTPLVAKGKLYAHHALRSLIIEQMALPNHSARWCTRKLKLDPYYQWLATQTPCVSYVGLRADEMSRPGMIFPDADGVTMDFPMRRWGWTEADVREFLDRVGVVIPDRTDCAACFWQRIGEWYLLWRDHLGQFMEAEQLEDAVSAHRGETYTFRSPQRDSWPARLKDLRARFEAGDIPERSLAMMDKRRLIGSCRVCTL